MFAIIVRQASARRTLACGSDHIAERHELTLFTDDEYSSAFRQAGLRAERMASPMEGRDRYVADSPRR
jgi:hypothetical protein